MQKFAYNESIPQLYCKEREHFGQKLNPLKPSQNPISSCTPGSDLAVEFLIEIQHYYCKLKSLWWLSSHKFHRVINTEIHPEDGIRYTVQPVN